MGADTLLVPSAVQRPHPGVDEGPLRHPLVSVIIPTKNSERTIRPCLESVCAQTYRNFEIVVVDNFSSDATVQIAKEYADLVLLAGPERTSQVKLGAANSKGDFIYKIDSDFVLEPSVLEKAVRVALDERAVGVVIPNLSYPKISFWSEVRFIERLSYVGSKQIEAARNPDSSSPTIILESTKDVPAPAQAIAWPRNLRDSKISLRSFRASSSDHMALFSALPSTQSETDDHRESNASCLINSR